MPNWLPRKRVGWVSSGKQLQCSHTSPSLRVTSDRRSGRTEDKTPAELREFIGCCCGCISHIRGALCCQARFQSRAPTAFVSPQRLVIKAAARRGGDLFTFSFTYSTWLPTRKIRAVEMALSHNQARMCLSFGKNLAMERKCLWVSSQIADQTRYIK